MDPKLWSVCQSFFIPKEEESNDGSLNFDPNILLLNIQCLNSSKLDSLSIDIENFNIKFICLTETWCTCSSQLAFYLNGYKPGITIFVVGDFNVDSSCNSQEYQNLCKALNIFGLTSRVAWPTRVTSHTATVIDHVFSNCSNKATLSVIDNEVSDHRTVLLDYCHIQPHKIPQAKRTFNEHFIKSFMDDLSNEPMHELYIERDINEAFTTFSDIFLHYFEKHFPKRRRFTSSYRNKEWVTEEVRLSSCNLKNLYYLKLCHQELEPSYKVEKSGHAQLIKETNKFFYQYKIVQSDNPVKSAWNTINQLSNKNRIQIQLAIAQSGQKVDETKQIANLFNEYFRDTPINISKQVNQQATANNIDIGTPSIIVQDTIFLFPYAHNYTIL
nr:unnamed protein product [Callosobruchus analis]